MITLPPNTLDLLNKADSEQSLYRFIKYIWPAIEPGTKFVDGWVIQAICEHLEAVHHGQINRLLINVPPGCMKSLTTNVLFPAWEWGPRNCPHLRYVSAAYAEKLTVRDNDRTRKVIKSDAYQKHWGGRFALSSSTKIKYETDQMGFRVATSVGGTVTGERGDRVIVDDPHNADEAESDAVRESTLRWFTESLTTRTNSEASAIIVIMQRLHSRDVAGHILASELGYDHLCLPMEYEPEHPSKSRTALNFVDPRQKDGELLWPGLFPASRVETDKKAMMSHGGSYAVSGQFQQRPVPRGGGLFKEDWFQFVDEAPKSNIRVRGWDLAATEEAKNKKAAYTVGCLMSYHKEGIYVEDVVRFRGSPKEVDEKIKETAKRDGASVIQDFPQDPGQAGKQQKRYLISMLNGYIVYCSPETGSKENRARPLASQAEAGNVYLVRGNWNNAFVSEATMFPNGDYKDQVDGASRAHSRIVEELPTSSGVWASPEVFY